MQKKYSSYQRILTGLIALLVIVLITGTGWANSPAPRETYWFDFSTDRSTLVIEGFQIVQCESDRCLQPLLIIQQDVCNQSGCLHTKGISGSTCSCADNSCVWSVDNIAYAIRSDESESKHLDMKPRLRILGQYRDSLAGQSHSVVIPSNVFQLQSGHDALPFSVRVNDRVLAVSQLTKNQSKNRQFPGFKLKWEQQSYLLIALSVGSELVVAYFYLQWLKIDRQHIFSLLLSILLVHGFSLLIVWRSFPALAVLVTPGVRMSGIAWIFLSIIYGLLLIHSSKKQAINDWRVIIISLAYLFLTWVISSIFQFQDYGSPVNNGLDRFWVLPLSEVFVWLYEAWIIYIAARRNLSGRQSLFLSLLMNLVSLFLGLILIEFAFK